MTYYYIGYFYYNSIITGHCHYYILHIVYLRQSNLQMRKGSRHLLNRSPPRSGWTRLVMQGCYAGPKLLVDVVF